MRVWKMLMDGKEGCVRVVPVMRWWFMCMNV